MGETDADREWMRGYDTARTRCLTQGLERAHHDKPSAANRVFESGYDWGLWDYEDANGLPHRRRQGA
jgi:hypothetical protein